MFKLILLLAISCLAMQPDKTLHFQAGLVSGAVVTMIAKDYTQSKSNQNSFFRLFFLLRF